MSRFVHLLSFVTLLATLSGAISSQDASTPLFRRDESTVDISEQKLPFLDYEGIQAAAEVAMDEELRRRGLIDDSDPILAKRRNRAPRCKKIHRRKEWRQLTRRQQKAYMRATKCLNEKDDFGISPISTKLYDAFTYIHENNWFAFHGCAPFAPWHRWFTWLREHTIREVCGYKGPFPYWNYTADYQDIFASPIFSGDPETGFGSHGTEPYEAIAGASGFKVEDGAFANMMVSLPEPHYLTRNFSQWKDVDPTGQWGKALGKWVSPEQLEITLAQETFWDFETVLDGLNAPNNLGIHNTMHFNLMGDWNGPSWLINTPYFPFASTAPNDPMFFPHHGYVDAVFWKWQQKPGHQWLYNGSTDIGNLTKTDAKHTDLLPFSTFGPDVPVLLALKTENYPMCYTYDEW